MNEKNEGGMGEVIQIDEAQIRDHLSEMVRGTVEEALNTMPDAEAERLCDAGRYERSDGHLNDVGDRPGEDLAAAVLA